MRIRVYNVSHGEKVSLHLPLLVGDIDQKSDDGEIQVWNASAHNHVKTKWPIIEGAFKVMVKLIPGENVICLRHLDEILKIVLFFCYPHYKHFVRPVYIICADDDGYFQGPDGEDCSPDSALERIKLGAMLIQTFTAEKMKEHGFWKSTFQLEVDSNFEPICTVFRSKLPLEQAHSMTGNQLWTHFAKELMTSNLSDKDLCKWYCFMSFTRYDPPPSFSEPPKTHTDILKHTKGHTALGGGGLALFGTGNLHTWAPSVEELYTRFTDTRKIDRLKYMDDSAYREFYWANYATGLGASLHELGHTFDLAHTPSGIMARGFDDLHKVFIVQRSRSPSNHSNGDHGNSDHRYSNHDRSSRGSSIDKGEGQTENLVLEHTARRYKDVCYGSPFRRPFSRRNSNSSNIYIAPPPVVFKVEPGFKPLPQQQTVSISVKNYDGSQTHQTITKDNSYETVTEVTLGESGQLLSRHCRRERHLSNSSNSSTISHSSQSPTRVIPSRLPNSPTELCLPNIQYIDDGAHWYRSSAVLLRFHRWFNKHTKSESRKHLSLSGSRIKSCNGLRLVELRTEPEGLVFHHWEFLSETPPTEFMMKLSLVQNIPTDTRTVTFLAIDDLGHILKKKVDLDNFER